MSRRQHHFFLFFNHVLLSIFPQILIELINQKVMLLVDDHKKQVSFLKAIKY